VCGQLEVVDYELGAGKHEGDGEDLATLMCVGDNFVVPTHQGNNEGVEFYSLKCQKTNHIVQE
jgi:hypothetical protein